MELLSQTLEIYKLFDQIKEKIQKTQEIAISLKRYLSGIQLLLITLHHFEDRFSQNPTVESEQIVGYVKKVQILAVEFGDEIDAFLDVHNSQKQSNLWDSMFSCIQSANQIQQIDIIESNLEKKFEDITKNIQLLQQIALDKIMKDQDEIRKLVTEAHKKQYDKESKQKEKLRNYLSNDIAYEFWVKNFGDEINEVTATQFFNHFTKYISEECKQFGRKITDSKAVMAILQNQIDQDNNGVIIHTELNEFMETSWKVNKFQHISEIQTYQQKGSKEQSQTDIVLKNQILVQTLPILELKVEQLLSLNGIPLFDFYVLGQKIQFYPNGKTVPESKSEIPDKQTVIFGRKFTNNESQVSVTPDFLLSNTLTDEELKTVISDQNISNDTKNLANYFSRHQFYIHTQTFMKDQLDFHYVFKETSGSNSSYLKLEEIPYLLYEGMVVDLESFTFKIIAISPRIPSKFSKKQKFFNVGHYQHLKKFEKKKYGQEINVIQRYITEKNINPQIVIEFNSYQTYTVKLNSTPIYDNIQTIEVKDSSKIYSILIGSGPKCYIQKYKEFQLGQKQCRIIYDPYIGNGAWYIQNVTTQDQDRTSLIALSDIHFIDNEILFLKKIKKIQQNKGVKYDSKIEEEYYKTKAAEILSKDIENELQKYVQLKDNPNRTALCLENGMVIALGTYEKGDESGLKQTPWEFRVKINPQKINN